ncbi:MAG: hypothetical protein M3Z54_04245, partial [Gemmatimonadota bacterium]|nr:hypothetical protein [Gemmatimonadota bacterium]
MSAIRFEQHLSGRSVVNTMHGAVSIAFISALIAGAATMFAGSELPDLGGGNSSFAYSVNDKGDVVGKSYNSNFNEHATIWVGGLPTDLGTLGGASSAARAVSSSGIIVGSAEVLQADGTNGFPHAALWPSASSAPIDLGTLGGWNSQASGVNANGDAVGLSWVTDNSTSHATFWSAANHAAVDLNFNNAGYSEALGINAAGDIAGYIMDANWAYQAVLWTGAAHSPLVLQTLGGAMARAWAINDKGDVVGESQIVGGTWRPTLWAAPAHAPADLGTPVAGAFGMAYGVNAAGDIVGTSGTGVADGSKHATLW